MAREMAREVARAEVQALTGAMLDAAGAVLSADDLSADEVGASLRDVVDVFSKEIERRISGWVSEGIDVDPEVPTVPTEEKPMELSEQDKKAIEIAKAAREHPELKERMRKVDEARAAKDPIEKQHPISKMATDSPVLAEYEVEVLEVMSKDRCSHEVAIGKIARDPAYHDLKRRYREEQRAMRNA
jgi:vacuolar-type H+-ATPase subunit I/STV1